MNTCKRPRSPPDTKEPKRVKETPSYLYDLPSFVSFKQLADKFTELSPYLRTSNKHKDRYTIDFGNQQAVRILNRALLSVYFNLDVEIPSGNLCPIVSNRLNYVKWIASHLVTELPEGNNIRGLDIGTGASCVYPLLAVRVIGNCTMVGTDIDAESVAVASKNVDRNGLQNKIQVYLNQNSQVKLPTDVVGSQTFTFCMCNPPFYQDVQERRQLAQEKQDKPLLITDGTDTELYCEGGEQGFLSGLVKESAELQTKILWYTTMAGKKSTIPVLRSQLKSAGARQVREFKLVQGKTTRWVLAWSFGGPTKLELEVPEMESSPKEWFTGTMEGLQILVEEEPSKDGEYICSAKNKTWTRQWRRNNQTTAPSEVGEPVLVFEATFNGSKILLKVEPSADYINTLMSLFNHLRSKLK